MSTERLFDGRHLRADLVREGHRRLMVSFDWRVIGRTGFRDAQPNRTFLDGGFDQLIIGAAANDWFINPETTALEAALAALPDRYDEVRAVGFSMGGYGALRLSRALRIARVVTVSAQLSIDPLLAPWEWRYRKEAAGFDGALGDLARHADRHVAGHVLIDDLIPADLAHARALQALFPALRIVRLTGGGHPATQVLRAARRAGMVQRLAMDDGGDPRDLLRAHRNARQGQQDYWARLAQAAEPTRPLCAAAARGRAALLDELGQGASGG